MTYNWNTMVDITVPTGTNGWLYSGEVIINGVKVRFPVGVPTSVPEPAAALLNKMIELEKEDAENTAKPNNHYVGSVTIPAGKTLTLENGAQIVHAPVVILPETVLTGDTIFPISDPLSGDVAVGDTVVVNYNGTDYECKVFDCAVLDYPIAGVAFGNVDKATNGETTGGNTDAPFMVALFPDGAEEDGETFYGLVADMNNGTSVTLSIVKKSESTGASGGGAGVLVVNVTFDANDDMTEFTNATKDKTFAEIKAVYEAGGIVHCRSLALSGPLAGAYVEWPNVVYGIVDGDTDAFMFNQWASSMPMNMITIQSDETVTVAYD